MALSPRLRWCALSGLIGVVAFITDWLILGATRSGYSPVGDAISELAVPGTSTRGAMTVGFVAFGVGVPLYALALRRALPGPAWISALTTGLATIGVAAAPLRVADAAHGIAAGVGYVTLVGVPLLAVFSFRARNARGWMWASVACGLASTIALTASLAEPGHGLTQRLGLGITDLWIIATAWTMWHSGRLPAAGRSA